MQTDPTIPELISTKPAATYPERHKSHGYWISPETGKVKWGDTTIRGSDPGSFVSLGAGYAKDKYRCYCLSSQLRGADPRTFEVLNHTYAKDAENVWTFGGKIKDVDAATFRVCDSGYYPLPSGIASAPYGYGKDRNRVYYYDFDGKPNAVRKAHPETFESLGDGLHAKDREHVYYGGHVLKGATPAAWTLIDDLYSKTDKHVYYGGRPIVEAHAGSFEYLQGYWSKDAEHCFFQDRLIDEADPSSFRAFSTDIAADARYVYGFLGKILMPYHEDPVSIGRSYFRIADRIYSGSVHVTEADVSTFQVLDRLSQDQKRQLRTCGRTLTPEEEWACDGFFAHDNRNLYRGNRSTPKKA